MNRARWYIAECQQCVPITQMPFLSESVRDTWMDIHSDQHPDHDVKVWIEMENGNG